MRKLALLLLLTSFYLQVSSQIISQWRGNDRRGIYPSTEISPATDTSFHPGLIWSNKEIGNGYGSPVITSDRIYITGEVDSLAYLFCFDQQGKIVWRSEFGPEWVKTFPGSRSAPTVVDNLVYVISGMGNLACFNAADGKRLWMTDMEKELHGRLPYHGHSESPLINGDLVYIVPGGGDTNVVAFDRYTGKIAWISKGLGYGSAYNSPVLITLPERKIIVTFTSYALLGLDAATGELLFSHDQVNIPADKRMPGMGDTHSNSVWFEDGCIYYFAGDGNGAVKLDLLEGGRKVEQVWRNATVDNYMGGFIKDGNLIYSCLFEKRKLITIDSRDGSVIDSLAVGRGNIISDGHNLYYYNLRGEVNRLKPGEKPVVTGTFKVTEGTKEHFSHPVIDKGIMYLRHGNTLMAYKL